MRYFQFENTTWVPESQIGQLREVTRSDGRGRAIGYSTSGERLGELTLPNADRLWELGTVIPAGYPLRLASVVQAGDGEPATADDLHIDFYPIVAWSVLPDQTAAPITFENANSIVEAIEMPDGQWGIPDDVILGNVDDLKSYALTVIRHRREAKDD